MRETRVALGIADSAHQEEVLHYLDRLPRVEIVGAAGTGDSLRGLIRDRVPDLVVATPELLVSAEGTAVIAIALRETVAGLRAAIRAGARGFYIWPEERDGLGRDIGRLGALYSTDHVEDGTVIAVLGARGGAGATFLSTNLAAALARAGTRTVLADLDPVCGDVAPALGLPPEEALPSTTDLVPVSEEITQEHLSKVLQTHPSGISVLLAPPKASPDARLEARSVAGMIGALRSHFQATVLHLPRGLDEAVLTAVELADHVLVVVTLDVVGIRVARRLLDGLRAAGVGRHLRLVVNKAGRGEVVPEDAELVLDTSLACVIGTDRGVQKAQNRGELIVGRRGPLSRRISRLAGQLMERRAA